MNGAFFSSGHAKFPTNSVNHRGWAWMSFISESARTRLEQLRAKAGFPGATLAFVSARTYR
jgi:hypothetical protein